MAEWAGGVGRRVADRLAAIAAEVFRCESVAELVDRAAKA